MNYILCENKVIDLNKSKIGGTV